MILEILCLALVLLCTALVWRRVSSANLPPRVPSVPFVGSLPFMRKGAHGALRDWHNKYGPIITVQMGSFRAIVIGQLDILKEAFGDCALQGRPEFPHFQYMCGGKRRGLTFNEGPHHEELKDFVRKTLKDYGFGKQSMEGMLHEDVEDFLSRLPHNKPVSIKPLFNLPNLRSLWRIATGQRYELDDKNLNLIFSSFSTAISTATGPGFLMPWFNSLFPSITKFKTFTRAVDLTKGLVREKVKEHVESGSSRKADFIDALLEEMEGKKHISTSAFHSSIAMENISNTVSNIFGGGMQTTGLALKLGLTLLATHPEVQEQFAEELRREVDPGQLPKLSDQARVPVAEGIINEILRMDSGFGIPHKCTADTMLRGYKIPKNTLVFANFNYIQNNPAVFPNPEKFDPDRYHKHLDLHKKMVLFSSGKRMCPAEPYARNVIFLFLAGICQRFSVSFDSDSEIPCFDKSAMNVNTFNPSKDYNVTFTPRK